MLIFTTLDIIGYRDEPVPNTFVHQDGESAHLAILYPGFYYRATMPALYYPERLLAARGADVLRVETAYDRAPDYQSLPEPRRRAWFEADAAAARDAALAHRDYTRVTLVGKSIGTLALGHLLAAGGLPERADYVWLTPLLRVGALRASIIEAQPRSLFVIGTADGEYRADYLAEVEEATGGGSVVIEGADHSLEVGGDVLASLEAMQRVVRELASFLFGG
jgi:hypothetical protein